MSSPNQLVEGFRRFRKLHYVTNDTLIRKLMQGQSPKILVVACCDSRVDPSLVLDCSPGDLFVVRNVANLVPPSESRGQYHGTCSALEFGVRNLGIKHIIVLGHAQCGGIRALLDGDVAKDASFLAEWMKIASGALEKVERELRDASYDVRRRACEQYSILGSLNNLMSFPWIREAVERGELALHGWYFDIEHGELLGYDATSGQFEAL